MLSATFEENALIGTLCLKLKGHAGLGETGKDIVCSAASILAYTVAKAISFMYEEKKLRKKPNIVLKEGDTTIICKPKDDSYAEALHTFFIAEVGYSLLSQSYPNHVELTPFGKA